MFFILYKNDYSTTSHIAKYRWVTYETYVIDQYKVGTYADEISAQALANSLNINVTIIGTSDGLQNSVNTFFSGRSKHHYHHCKQKWISFLRNEKWGKQKLTSSENTRVRRIKHQE